MNRSGLRHEQARNAVVAAATEGRTEGIVSNEADRDHTFGIVKGLALGLYPDDIDHIDNWDRVVFFRSGGAVRVILPQDERLRFDGP